MPTRRMPGPSTAHHYLGKAAAEAAALEAEPVLVQVLMLGTCVIPACIPGIPAGCMGMQLGVCNVVG